MVFSSQKISNHFRHFLLSCKYISSVSAFDTVRVLLEWRNLRYLFVISSVMFTKGFLNQNVWISSKEYLKVHNSSLSTTYLSFPTAYALKKSWLFYQIHHFEIWYPCLLRELFSTKFHKILTFHQQIPKIIWYG